MVNTFLSYLPGKQIWRKSQVWSLLSWFQPVWQSKQRTVKGYCPIIYTVPFGWSSSSSNTVWSTYSNTKYSFRLFRNTSIKFIRFSCLSLCKCKAPYYIDMLLCVVRIFMKQTLAIIKSQMKSECIDEIIDFPKYHQKKFDRFLPWKVIQTMYVMHSPE